MPNPEFDAAELSQVRLDNALVLFDEFVAQNVRTPDAAALRGLERRFAEHLLIQPSYWSQIKSRTRQIGERLARQFEGRCRKPAGWMDIRHAHPPTPGFALQVPPQESTPSDTSSLPRDDDERFITGLVLSYYRRHPQRARARLLELLQEVLAPPPRAPSPAATAAQGEDAHTLWLRSQRGVAPLKRQR
jgi:hypothetical protein